MARRERRRGRRDRSEGVQGPLPDRCTRPARGGADAFLSAWTQGVLLCGVGALPYLRALANPLLWDDKLLVLENRFLRSPSFLGQILTTDIFRGAGVPSRFYRPLQPLTYMIDYALWGDAAFGYHLSNLLLHLATGLLVWRLARHLLPSTWAALWVGISFLVHPVQVEAVAYVAGRADVLATLALLAATLFVMRSARDETTAARSLAAAAGLYVLALLGKETAIVFPFLLIALGAVGAFGPTMRARDRRLWTAAGAMVAVLGVYVMLRRALALGAGHSPRPTPFPAILWIVPRTVLAYLDLFLFPVRLHMERLALPAPTLLTAVAAMLVGLSWWTARRHPAWRQAWIAGMTWFGVSLVPVANVVSLNAAMAEHWLYLPGIGLLVALAAGGGAMLEVVGTGPALRRVLVGAAVLLPVAWGVRAAVRTLDWSDEVTFFERTLRDAPDSARVHELLGTHDARAGDGAGALAHYAQALAADPTYALAYSNRGRLYYLARDYARAESDCRRAIELDPLDPNAYNNLGNVYYDQQRLDEALASYEQATKLFPLFTEAYENIGNVRDARGELDEARRAFERVTMLASGLGRGWYKLGMTLVKMGEPAAGAEALRKAAALDPTYAGRAPSG